MPVAVVGRIIAAVASFFFGYLLFRGMVLEWRRRDKEMHGHTG